MPVPCGWARRILENLSRRHKDVVHMLVVASVHCEDRDVGAVFEDVLVEIGTKEVEYSVVVVVDGCNKVVLVCGRIFYNGFIEAEIVTHVDGLGLHSALAQVAFCKI